MIQDSDKMELFKIQLQQAESVRRHYQSVDVAVKIPAYQSIAYALAVTILAGMVCLYFEWPLKFTIPGLPSLFVLVFLWIFKGRRQNWDSLIWNLEERINLDLNDDKEIGEPDTKALRIDYVARKIMERHYLDRQPTDRDTCEVIRLCTQPEWNNANTLLKKLGIKGERGFTIPDYGRAFDVYRRRVSVFEDAITIRHESDNGSERMKF